MKSILSKSLSKEVYSEVETKLLSARPIVFVGPYEHHSNEITWRECFAEVIEIELDKNGLLDLKDLEKKVSSKEFKDRMKIGSFSAASNVTGIKTPVYEVAKILHRHDCLVFFDFAAIGPYTSINVSRDANSYFDAVFFSPHKFLGGPGSTGILVIHEKIYPTHLPPTCAGGGTVDFVNLVEQEYTQDIEAREKPGTPGILQTMKAALAFELKEKLGLEDIEKREADYIARAIKRFSGIPEIEIVGKSGPDETNCDPFLQRQSRRLLSASSFRGPPFKRPLRDPVAGGLFLRRSLRTPAPRHRLGQIPGIQRGNSSG